MHPISAVKDLIPPMVKERLRPTWRKLRVISATDRSIGHDLIHDIKARLPSVEISTVFDVGAHYGETAIKFAVAFPRARIHCFEPDPKNYVKLVRNLGQRCILNCAAIGATETTVKLERCADSAMTRVSANGTIPVQMTTLVNYCGSRPQHVDVLKIDAEGHDMDVLKGAEPLMAAGGITLIQIECSANPENTYHVPFEDVCAYLIPFGYRLFGIYNQNASWPSARPCLRWVDAAFVLMSTSILASRG
jgi:FkbM family methyltransferase